MNCSNPIRRPLGVSWYWNVIGGLMVVVIMSASSFAQYQVRKSGTPVQQQASISITDPAGNTTWEKGKRYTIRWTSQGTITSVQIVLVDQAGESHDVIRRTTNSGVLSLIHI